MGEKTGEYNPDTSTKTGQGANADNSYTPYMNSSTDSGGGQAQQPAGMPGTPKDTQADKPATPPAQNTGTNPYGAPDGNSSWSAGSYAGSHHYYDDGYVRPSQQDLDAENARRASGGVDLSGWDHTIPLSEYVKNQGTNSAGTTARDPRSGRVSGYDLANYPLGSYPSSYTDFSGNTTPAEEAPPPEPVDTSAVRTDLLNSIENAAATGNLLKNAGYDFSANTKLEVPGQVALPDRIPLPTDVALPGYVENPNVALPNYINLPDNVALPNYVDLPNRINLPDAINFQDAMNQAGVNVGRINNVDINPEAQLLDQMTAAQREQAILQSDRAVQQGTADLQRNLQDAQDMYGVQQRQIDIDEQRAKDNQALYAEARGDRGGIGQAQYDTIQNTAATNRLTVQNEQTKLATDTARQIADLRSQGEFEKANQLLAISQNHLSQLMNLYQWAKEANIGIDEFNLQVEQWENSYKLNLIDAQLSTQSANLNLANTQMAQEMNQFNTAYQQENSQYNARWNQAQQLFNDALQQENSQYNARWNQAQQLWQNEFNQENSQYNARWNQAQQLFNAAYNQENSQFEARRAAANDYFNNQLNAANLDLNQRKALLEAQINAANATGAFENGTATYAAQQNAREILAASGQALLYQGIIPTAEQLAAMGMTAEQAQNAYDMKAGTSLSYYPTIGVENAAADLSGYGYGLGGSDLLSGSDPSVGAVNNNASTPYTRYLDTMSNFANRRTAAITNAAQNLGYAGQSIANRANSSNTAYQNFLKKSR